VKPLLLVSEAAQSIPQDSNMIGQTASIAGVHRNVLMNAAKVVEHIMQRNRVTVIVYFLAVAVRESRKSPHVHSHGEVLALLRASAHMLGVQDRRSQLHVATDAHCRRIARVVIHRRTVNLLQHGVVNIRTEGILHGLKIRLVSVCGDLDAVADSAGAIFHEVFCPSCPTSAH